MGVHARKSASGAKRWMACPGSLHLADGLASRGIRSQSSVYAQLGTAAHGLAETCLLSGADASAWLGGFIYLKLPEEDPVLFGPWAGDELDDYTEAGCARAGWPRYEIDDDMCDAVQLYLDVCREERDRLGPHAAMAVELRCDLSSLRPDMFGTSDCAFFLPFDHVTVVDYKHGQGVAVEVEENEQELYYALGVAIHYDWAFETIDLVVVQPRCPHADGPVRRWSTDKAYLRAFQERLVAAADAADDPAAPRVAGDHCTFCVGIPFCDAIKERSFATALADFAEDDAPVEVEALPTGPQTSDADLEHRLRALPMIDAFVKGLEAEAMRRLRESPTGEAFGYKLVRKKSNRKLHDEVPILCEGDDAPSMVPVTVALVELGFPEDELYEPRKLKGPAKIEKLRPPELMAKLKLEKVKAPAKWIMEQIARFTHKPPGGIAVAPASDPRPAVLPDEAAVADFQDDAGDDE